MLAFLCRAKLSFACLAGERTPLVQYAGASTTALPSMALAAFMCELGRRASALGVHGSEQSSQGFKASGTGFQQVEMGRGVC